MRRPKEMSTKRHTSSVDDVPVNFPVLLVEHETFLLNLRFGIDDSCIVIDKYLFVKVDVPRGVLACNNVSIGVICTGNGYGFVRRVSDGGNE
jgi:hypothetical protein